jgi:hypothetical protein
MPSAKILSILSSIEQDSENRDIYQSLPTKTNGLLRRLQLISDALKPFLFILQICLTQNCG